MNRRAFLRQVSIAAASGLLLPEIAKELIAPKRTIFLPALRWFGWDLGHVIVPLPVQEMLRVASARTILDRFVGAGPIHFGDPSAGAPRVIGFRRPRVFQRALTPFDADG